MGFVRSGKIGGASWPVRKAVLIGAAFAALAVVAACGQGGRQLATNVAGRYATAGIAGSGLAGSELVNGGEGTAAKNLRDLDKTLNDVEKAPPKQPPKASFADLGGGGFKPHMCKSIAEGGSGFFSFYGSLATFQLGKLMAYCRNLESREQSTASSGGEQGGCVWKGRSYGPGQSIYASQVGRIVSSDLTIYGESFEALSGASGPWQQCQCSSSSGKWGCV